MRTYDLVMTHKLDADDFFIHRVERHCAEKGINFFLIEPLWVEEFHRKLELGEVSSRVLLNLHSEHHQPQDIYHRLVDLAFEKKIQIIDPPDISQAAFDKARLHPRLLAAGFNVPDTIIVPWDRVAATEISALDLANLGVPFVIKPALGYGKRGVILEAQDRRDLERCAAQWPHSDYLLQRKIIPREFEQGPAYFRLFYVFGSIWCCWWNCYTDQYRILLDAEREQLGLHPLRELPRRLAALTGMNFFSTEVALTVPGEYVLIDYVNDQCHMLTQSSNPKMGVPDEIVAGIALRLVEGAEQLIRNTKPLQATPPSTE